MTEANLIATYEALYAEVAALHAADEYVGIDLMAKLGEAEMALTDYQIANGTFKW